MYACMHACMHVCMYVCLYTTVLIVIEDLQEGSIQNNFENAGFVVAEGV